MFASFRSKQEHFTHGMYMTIFIRPSDIKIEPIMFYEGINAKVFRRSIAFVIAVVVTSRSSSLHFVVRFILNDMENCYIMFSLLYYAFIY